MLSAGASLYWRVDRSCSGAQCFLSRSARWYADTCHEHSLFVLGLKLLGKQVLIGSLYAMTVSSLMIDGINSLYQFRPLDPVLAVVYGGILCGAAFGLMLRQGATTGGTELAARLLKIKVQQLPIGKLCLIIDLVVIATYSLTFRQLTQALYSIAALYICTAMMDKVVYGGKSAKLAYIISPHHEEITHRLLELDLGVTLLEGAGAYYRKSTEVVMCAFSRNYIIPVKSWCSKLIRTHLSLYVIHMRSWARALVSMIPPDCKIA